MIFSFLPYLALLIGFAVTVVGILARSDGHFDPYGKVLLVLGFLAMSVGVAILYLSPPNPPEVLINERFEDGGWRGLFPSGAVVSLTATCDYVYSAEPTKAGKEIDRSERHLNIMFADIDWRHDYTEFDLDGGYYVASEKFTADMKAQFNEKTNSSFDQRVEFELDFRHEQFRETFIKDWLENGRNVGISPLSNENLPVTQSHIFLDIRFPEHVFRRPNTCAGQIEVWNAPK